MHRLMILMCNWPFIFLITALAVFETLPPLLVMKLIGFRHINFFSYFLCIYVFFAMKKRSLLVAMMIWRSGATKSQHSQNRPPTTLICEVACPEAKNLRYKIVCAFVNNRMYNDYCTRNCSRKIAINHWKTKAIN